jgi:hypothetical protein
MDGSSKYVEFKDHRKYGSPLVCVRVDTERLYANVPPL